MISFFGDPESKVFALETNDKLDNFSIEKQDIVVTDKYISMKCVNKNYPAIIDEPPD